MVIFLPIVQLGCRRACSGRTRRNSSLIQVRKGPPEAVRIILRTSPARPPWRHWKIALCSLSTGRICTPFAAAFSMTSAPAITSVSLLANATSLPASTAVTVGTSPAAPTMAESTRSFSGRAAISLYPSGPDRIFNSRGSPGSLPSRRAHSSSKTATIRGRNLAICSRSRTTFLPAARAVTRKRSRLQSMTASACVPIEPVEPKMAIFFMR